MADLLLEDALHQRRGLGGRILALAGDKHSLIAMRISSSDLTERVASGILPAE